MADVVIRQATIEDAEQIFEIENMCFPDPWSLESIEYEFEENPRAFYVVAEHSGEVVGYAGLWWIEDEGHITNVAVKPGYRNRRIGEGIIDVLLDYTIHEGIRHHTLEVRRSNEPAINLYEKFGFQVEGVRKGYYQHNGEDALIMWRHASDEEIAEAIRMMEDRFTILAIESSCDETAAAVVRGGRTVLSNVISSQIDIHKAYGGVVPEIASRHHLDNINHVVRQALEEAGQAAGSEEPMTMDDIDAIAVTYGPGLVGALLIGLATAKAYALATGKPLIGVHHIQGHISANYIEHPDLEPPFMALIVSGGHTNIVEVTDYNECHVLGGTRDDAAGEAYDKVARVLGLGYPGGPLIDRIAKEGNPDAVEFKRVFLEKDSMDFSFSGIKTGVLNYVNSEKQAGREINVADVAASFQQAVLDVIVKKTVDAARKMNKDKIVMAGGVSANSHLREMMESECKKHGIKLYYPSPILCTDNAAMIGCAAHYKYRAGGSDDLTLDAIPGLPL